METVTFRPSEEYKDLAEKVYKQEKERILDILPQADIHHIGSTSIPGLLTKGDLDINIRVDKEDFAVAVEELGELYEINQPHNWTDTFASFKSDKLEIDFGAQLTVIDSKDDTFLVFRDTLKDNSDLITEYNQIKEEFQEKSMDEYREAKMEFCNRVKGL